MITRRATKNAGCAFFVRQCRDKINATSNFEGTDRLVVFVLDEVSAADQLRKSWPFKKRSRPQLGPNPREGFLNVFIRNVELCHERVPVSVGRVN